jgi:hypothetical protein
MALQVETQQQQIQQLANRAAECCRQIQQQSQQNSQVQSLANEAQECCNQIQNLV